MVCSLDRKFLVTITLLVIALVSLLIILYTYIQILVNQAIYVSPTTTCFIENNAVLINESEAERFLNNIGLSLSDIVLVSNNSRVYYAYSIDILTNTDIVRDENGNVVKDVHPLDRNSLYIIVTRDNARLQPCRYDPERNRSPPTVFKGCCRRFITVSPSPLPARLGWSGYWELGVTM